jgi:hypothetical protein
MSLQSILSDIDSLKTALDSCYPIPLDRLQKINYKFRLDWNYHSNKMEGGTLSFEETRSVMMEQLEIHGKPLRDVMEMRGHDDVIKSIQKLGQGDLRLTENRIKDIHKAIIFDEKDLPGRFKNRDNYIYNYAGERFDFTPKENTASALNTLTNWLNNALNAVKKGKNREKRTIPDIATLFDDSSFFRWQWSNGTYFVEFDSDFKRLSTYYYSVGRKRYLRQTHRSRTAI